MDNLLDLDQTPGASLPRSPSSAASESMKPTARDGVPRQRSLSSVSDEPLHAADADMCLGAEAESDTFIVGEYHLSACPICLERFTLDNPAIIVRCEHGFHLQCLESWRQRSAVCPVCLKALVGDEGRLMGDRDTRRRRRFRTAATSALAAAVAIASPVPEKVEDAQGMKDRVGEAEEAEEGVFESYDTIFFDSSDEPRTHQYSLWRWVSAWCGS